jgi:hypothetical protein
VSAWEAQDWGFNDEEEKVEEEEEKKKAVCIS